MFAKIRILYNCNNFHLYKICIEEIKYLINFVLKIFLQMEIAIIVPSLKDAAPVHVAVSIALNLAKEGNNVTVFYFSKHIQIAQPKEVRFQRLSFWSNIDWKKFDIVHSHSFVPDAFVFLKKPLKTKVKTVTTVHNYVYVDLKTTYNWMVSVVLGSAWLLVWTRFDTLVVLTDDAIKYYKRISFNKNIIRIYNGRDIEPNRDVIATVHQQQIAAMKEKYTYVIGVYSALIPLKRIDIVIRHLSRVDSGCLIILGEGPERKNLEALVSQHHLEQRVKFLGHIAQGHQYNMLFDIFAHPSLSEGFSLSLIEGALHKKKIVCSDILGFKEAFDENEVTFFHSEDEFSIDKAVAAALLDEEKPMRAYNKAMMLYSEHAMSQEYIKVYAG